MIAKRLSVRNASLALALAATACGPGNDKPPDCGTVVIAPGEVTLSPGATFTFTATIDGKPFTGATWTATGGTIDQGGKYLAPAACGTYQVAVARVDLKSLVACSALAVVHVACGDGGIPGGDGGIPGGDGGIPNGDGGIPNGDGGIPNGDGGIPGGDGGIPNGDGGIPNSDGGIPNGDGGTLATCRPGIPTPDIIQHSGSSVIVYYRVDSSVNCVAPTTIEIADFTVSSDGDAGVVFSLDSILVSNAGPSDTYNSVIISNLTPGVVYSFTAEGISASGGRSGRSSYSAGIKIYLLPGAPQSLVAQPRNTTSVGLTWTNPPYGGDGGTTGTIGGVYFYEQNSDGGFAPAIAGVNSGTTNAGTVYNLAPGTLHTFAVAEVLTTGQEGPLSNLASATTYAPPSVPTGVQATAGNRRIVVSWLPPLSSGSGPVTDYLVMQNHSTDFSGAADKFYVASSNGDGGSIVAVVNNADAGTQYFEVLAENMYGSGPNSTPPASATAFYPPSYLAQMTANPGTQQIGVSWKAPTNVGITAPDYYQVGLNDAGYSGYGAFDGGIAYINYDGGTSLILGPVADGTSYGVSVSAHNPDGLGPLSWTTVVPAPWNLLGYPPDNLVSGSTAVAAQGGVLLAGGTSINNALSAKTYYFPIPFDGYSLQVPTAMPSLGQPLTGHTTVAWQGDGGSPVVAITAGGQTTSDGGTFDFDGVQELTVPAVPSTATTWLSTGHTLPTARHDHAAALSGSNLYLMGGMVAGRAIAEVLSTTVNPDGTLPASAWTQQNSLPGARFGAASAVVGSRLYVIGGASNFTATGAIADVLHADIGVNGALGVWTGPTATNKALPAGRVYSTAQTDGSHLFVVGGALDPSRLSIASTDLLVGTVNADTGDVASWTINPVALYSPTTQVPTVYFNRYLFVIGPYYDFVGRTDPITGLVGP